MENFANAPPSITEIRSDKSGKSSDWTPRDALVAILRDIDKGELEPKQILIVYATKAGDNLYKTHYRCAGKFTTYECMGLLHDAVWRMHNDGG